MATPDKVLAIARKEIGYIEKRGNNTKFGQWYGMNYQPWCAMFVSYCFFEAGLPLPITKEKGFAYCPYGVRWFKQRNKLFKTAEVGDVVFFDWGRDGVSDHVGIVEAVLSNGWVKTIEGNTSPSDNSNGGQVMRRNRNSRQICGFGRPDWKILKPEFAYYRLIKLSKPLLRGWDVREWQKKMIELGYDLGNAGADGIFGKKSHQALKNFQKDRELTVDGILGPISWAETFKEDL